MNYGFPLCSNGNQRKTPNRSCCTSIFPCWLYIVSLMQWIKYFVYWVASVLVMYLNIVKKLCWPLFTKTNTCHQTGWFFCKSLALKAGRNTYQPYVFPSHTIVVIECPFFDVWREFRNVHGQKAAEHWISGQNTEEVSHYFEFCMDKNHHSSHFSSPFIGHVLCLTCKFNVYR